MATQSIQQNTTEQRERLFFFVMACALAITVVVAFSLFAAFGISSFGAPWWVHIHAVTFMAWISFYILQNTLIFRNSIALHRRLGRIGAAYVVWMVLVGLVLTPVTLIAGRSPPFFTPPYFLALDWVNIIVFAALFCAAIYNRKRTDWHRRLMLCATICVIAPAMGRLIVISGLPMTAPTNVAALLIFVFVAVLFDWSNRRIVHPAYAWGAGALVAFALVTELLAVFPPLVALAGRMAA